MNLFLEQSKLRICEKDNRLNITDLYLFLISVWRNSYETSLPQTSHKWMLMLLGQKNVLETRGIYTHGSRTNGEREIYWIKCVPLSTPIFGEYAYNNY